MKTLLLSLACLPILGYTALSNQDSSRQTRIHTHDSVVVEDTREICSAASYTTGKIVVWTCRRPVLK